MIATWKKVEGSQGQIVKKSWIHGEMEEGGGEAISSSMEEGRRETGTNYQEKLDIRGNGRGSGAYQAAWKKVEGSQGQIIKRSWI